MKEQLTSPLNPDARYSLITALKFAALPCIPLAFLGYMLWVFMSMTHIFFEANGYLEIESLREAFFDYVVSDLMEMLPFVGAYFCFLFVMGYYFSRLLLHPLKVVGEYCQKKLEDKKHPFIPSSQLVDFKLLSHFALIFFTYADEVMTLGRYKKFNVDPRYQNIQKPVFDKIFFLHFLLLVLVICGLTSAGLYVLSVDMHARIVELAIQTLSTPNKSLGHFLNSQRDILVTVQWGAVALMFMLYTFFSFYLIKKMSGVAYSYFVTMRRIMDGNPRARIFIRGNNPGHVYAHHFNQYMDQVFGESEKSEGDLLKRG